MVSRKVCLTGLNWYTDRSAAQYVPLHTSIPYVDTLGYFDGTKKEKNRSENPWKIEKKLDYGFLS